MPITPQDVANVDQINGLSLSETGERVVYCVGPSFHAKDSHKTQALRLAEVGVKDSARKITSGLFNDHSPAFDPMFGDIFFLSDRHNGGGAAQIYRLSSEAFGGEALPLTPSANTKGVSTFKISPNGHWLAYISADEPEEKNAEDKDTYVIVWRAAKDLGCLRILDLTGQIEQAETTIRTVVSVDSHVQSFTWSPDSTKILFRLAQSPDAESNSFPISEHIISIDPEQDGGKPTHVVTHDRLLSSESIWSEENMFYFLHAKDYTSAPALWTCGTEPGSIPTRVAFGETDDAADLVGIRAEVVVEVACGLDTRIDIMNSGSSLPFTAFETSKEVFSSWDIKRAGGKYIFVVARSSGVTGEAENIWSGSADSVGGTKGILSTKLSSHHEWMSAKELPQCAPFYWSIEDGTALQGIIAYPRGQQLKNLPTVVVPHGGPYGRDLLHMRIDTNYRYLLASHGFLVLCPNYRGSEGRGSTFARAANGGMGTLDYADVESMLAAAMQRGYVDRNKVAIAGYSQGGFLAAWGCTRPNSIWKAGVIGAGPTDWGSLIICSDLPDTEADLGGTAPWSPKEPHYLQGSPIRDVRNVKAPLLLVHGEKDERVPLTQAIGFMRGLVREADKAVSDASTLIIYPREGHPFQEKKHVEDQLTRVLAHIEKYLA
ncbi:alpha/beta-hydrolase [Mycena galericulata]|nr:alpha/beta-hydrolase [Mycena galericulata]